MSITVREVECSIELFFVLHILRIRTRPLRVNGMVMRGAIRGHLKYLLSSGHWSSRCRSPRHWIKSKGVDLIKSWKMWHHSNMSCLMFVINLYTLFLAILGSYFLIYSSEEGAGAIDMVLNAVALFFMIELDDLLVTNDDYAMVREATDAFIKEYMTKMEAMQDDANKTHQKQRFGVIGLTRLSKVGYYIESAIYWMAIIGGTVAPFTIFICFGDPVE
eukprot:780792_1